VVTTTGIGGAESQVYDLACSFHARGWRVGVVSMRRVHKQYRPLRAAGVKVICLHMSKGVPDPRALVRLARFYRRWRPDVVHSHMVHANLLARLARSLSPVPMLISTMHNQDEGAQWRYFAYRLTDRFSELTTNVSRLAVEEAVRRHAVPSNKVRLMRNGIRTERFARDPDARASMRSSLALGDSFTWLTVGRFVEAKRHSDLLAAIAIIRKQVPSVRLLIVGEGPLRPETERQIDAMDLHRNVSLLGFREDVPALMQAADAFVMSSAWEGLPLAMLEASASSLPIVATDVGGSGDVVEDGKSGFLMPVGEPASLAEAMLRIMRLPKEERISMGDLARGLTVSKFDLQKVADEWEAVYRSGLARHV